MGEWSKHQFGYDYIGNVAIVVAGTSHPNVEKYVCSLFDKVLKKTDMVYHNYVVEKDNKRYAVLFNVYGAPAMIDALSFLHDGGVNSVIFFGTAYGGFQNLKITSLIVPTNSIHFDGTYSHIDKKRNKDFPDRKLRKKIISVLKKEKTDFLEGTNISVPAFTLQPKHTNENYAKIKPISLEMELSSCLAKSKDIGIRSAGILMISDNKDKSIKDKNLRLMKRNRKKEILKLIIDNILSFNVEPIKDKNKYTINTHLASIIDDKISKKNVYGKVKK
jgi:purine-nucleoside phosphorylase